MKSGIIIAVIVVIAALGIISYSLGLQEDTGSQEIHNLPAENEQPLPKGKNLSINLSESIGVEANP